MSSPVHHPPDELLAAWVAGTTADGEGLLVACHLTLCPRCRAWCGALERVGASLALAGGEVDVPPPEALFDRLDRPAPAPAAAPPPSGPLDLPAPLRARVGPLADVRWRWVAPGMSRVDLHRDGGHVTALLRIRPSAWIPPHLHAGTERGIVLTGAYVDETGRFGRGDVQIRQPGESTPHTQRIEPGAPCVLLLVDDGPKLPTSPLGRLVGRMFDR